MRDPLVISDSESVDWEQIIDTVAPIKAESWTFGKRAAELVGENFPRIIAAVTAAMQTLPQRVKEASRKHGLTKNEMAAIAL